VNTGKSRAPERKPGDDITDLDSGKTTPSTDMQPEDAGTAESGSTGAKGNAAETAMKQTSKTGNEQGTKR
jgi:hypothetical protein